ncbi:hypothetical protein [Streptomyces qinzhouensis]|uniref:Large membrane protein n=1 Tax=Streptomyces qinzhouensis TaxID=2599401 RepID=A0A5B8IE50_9ACTN|nr:hypothetical protein [Streptomyces qinzhouensis]QDY76392.1 hypothetical protein FQU76_07400 [Streptomyces qinzhouensis]
MSGTRSTDDERARRRFPLVASVVAAVLVVGGGGACLAAAGTSGGNGGGGRAGGELPRLPVSAALSPAAGIAPGEPSPAGGILERQPGVTFPGAPDDAPVHRADGGPKAAEVTRAAKAFGLPGPVRSGGGWRSGPDADGTGAVLQVSARAPGAWSYGAYAGAAESDDCVKKADFCSGPYVPPGPGPEGTRGQAAAEPVSEARARQAAAPVLTALGLGDALVDARQTAGPTRVVTADPRLGGVRTRHYATVFHIGPDGRIVQANGFLSVPVKGKAYPLVSADRALKEANAAALGGGGGQAGPPACATAVPLDGVVEPQPRKERKAADCAPARQAGGRLPVTGAVLGLTAVHGTERVTFVPAWLFSVAPGGGAGAGFTLAQPAVEPRYLDRNGATTPGGDVPPAPPAPDPAPSTAPTAAPAPATPAVPGGSAVDSYRVDGRTLTLTFYGGVCETYRATAEENGGAVRVTVKGKWADPAKACIAIAKKQTAKVTLDAPLGDRKVVDASTGTAVRRG